MLAAPAWAEDAVSLRLNWYMGGVHAPFFLGKERGYYREAGIDLTQRGPRLGQHRAGRRGRHRYVRPGRLIVA